MNSYERQQYSIAKEYPDTTIHVLDSSKYKCLYFESKFEREEGNAAFVIKDLYEYEYETEKVTKLSFLTDAEKNGSLFYYAENDFLIMIDTEKNISLLNSDRNAVAKANIKELTFPNQKGDRYQIESVINARSDGKYVYINGSNPYHQGIVFVLDMSLKEKTAFLAGEGVILTALWNEQVQFFDAQSRILYRYDEETNEVASAAIDALQEIEYVKPMKNAYKMIILEGAQEYFVGNRDIDAVCAAIENRLRLALEENKGYLSVSEKKKE